MISLGIQTSNTMSCYLSKNTIRKKTSFQIFIPKLIIIACYDFKNTCKQKKLYHRGRKWLLMIFHLISVSKWISNPQYHATWTRFHPLTNLILPITLSISPKWSYNSSKLKRKVKQTFENKINQHQVVDLVNWLSFCSLIVWSKFDSSYVGLVKHFR